MARQDRPDGRHHLGLNLARVSIEDLPDGIDNKFRPGLVAGAVVLFPMNDKLDLETGAHFDMRGGKFEQGSDEDILKGNYLTIPGLVRMSVGSGDTGGYFKAGPEVSILLTAKAESTTGGQTTETDIKDQTKSADVAVRFVGGYDFPLGEMLGFVEGSFGLGLLDINDDPDSPISIKNRVISIVFGVGK